MDVKSRKILKKQKIVFFSVVAVALCASLVIFYGLLDDSSKKQIVQPAKIELPGDKINPQEIWQSKTGNEIKMLSKQLEYIEKTMLEMKKADGEKTKENEDLRQEVNKLKVELKTQMEMAKPVSKEGSNYVSTSDQTRPTPGNRVTPNVTREKSPGYSNVFSYHEDPFITGNAKQGTHHQQSQSAFNEVIMGKGKRTIQHVDMAIPAGTTVKALLVSSVDATCSINSKSDPQPVKLRIIDDGHLPKDVIAKLKGGLIIASAYGDISTERVYIRLERLTKVEANGEFIETSIAGFVSGEDGKFGVRGTVVDKSEKIVANAAKSGFLGGIGSILQSAVSKHEVNQYSFDVVKQGCAGGASSAFDTLADYYIRRAEQVMPVIQVTAGREVDITFTHFSEMGDLYTKDKVKEIRETSRKFPNNTQY